MSENTKSGLRTTFLAVRARERQRFGAAAETAMAAHLKATGLIAPGAVVGLFHAIGDEIDACAIVRGMTIKAALPRVVGKNRPLVFHLWSKGDATEAGPFGIREPIETAPVALPDVLLVPLLAVDRDGYRLGYGGGFYDRTLESLRSVGKASLAIGLAFPELVTDRLPREPHDIPVEWILTPDGLHRAATSCHHV